MNEQEELAGRIAKLLDDSADNVTPVQRQRLHEARQKALEAYRGRQAHSWVPAWLRGLLAWLYVPVSVGGPPDRTARSLRYLIPMAALILGLAGVVYMHSNGSPDIADIDAGLLTDELPLNALLDSSLDAWLKRSPR